MIHTPPNMLVISNNNVYERYQLRETIEVKMKGKCTLDQIYIKTHYNNTLKMESYFSWITSCISICRDVTIYDIECLLNILFENCIGVDNTLLDMFKK